MRPMNPDNWTGVEHPCFTDYDTALEPLTRDGWIDRADLLDDCDAFDAHGVHAICVFKAEGGTWETCPMGRQSKWQDWLPKETT